MYNAAIYLRLSQEDKNIGQSESINNQKEYLTRYVSEHAWNIYKIYADDGKSGLTYDRPAFNEMIADIESGKINLVLTKDLSRLGRDYIQTGYYIEKYFPEHGIRYIAVSDGIDTANNTNINNDIGPFKAVLNDMYAKDISKKVRVAFATKRINGQFIGAFAPFGYRKHNSDKNKLVKDETAANVVCRIYELYLSGKGISEIANMLNNDNIPCPSAYKLNCCNYQNKNAYKYLWTHESIKRILSNPTYAGHLTQHKQEKINYKSKKLVRCNKQDWVIVKNTHEPIITQSDFDTVQDMLKVHANNSKKTYEHTEHLLNGLLYCRDCGAKMTYRRNSANVMNIICSSYTRYGAGLCTSHRIDEQDLVLAVIQQLNQIAMHEITDDFYNNFIFESGNDITQSREKEIAMLDSQLKIMYHDRLCSIISESEYIEFSHKIRKRIAELNNTHNQNTKSIYDLIHDVVTFNRPDKPLLFALIERIEITKDKEAIITYKFKEPQQ